ncbi:MAG: sugar phosphate nucleotidyltransferase [Acidobacteriaceae bacterium]
MTTAIILAGGLGTRLRSAVPDLPKPMAPINGRPFLEHQMDYWIGQGMNHFVVSVGYMKEVIMEYFGSSYRATPLTYAIEEEPLGTGGGLLLAATGLNEPFLLLNGDTFFEVDFNELRKFHANHQSEWTCSLFRANENGRYMGMDVNLDGEIMPLKLGADESGRLANGGVYLINPSVLAKTTFPPGHKLSLEDDLLPAFRAQGGKLYGFESAGIFIDIGVPKDYFRAFEVLPHETR